jgi:hypothetical protein
MVSQIESKNPSEIALKEGKYIYCIVDSSQSQTFGPLGIGGRGDELYTICFNDIGAVVSSSPIKQYPVSRENVMAHEKAIEEVMKYYTVLPVRFVTIAKDEEKVKKILEVEHNKFKEKLQFIKDKKELGLKAIFREEVIYQEILAKYQDIKALKERLLNQSPEKTHYERMQIGKMVEDALEKEKKIYKEKILDDLSPLAVEVKLNYNYGECMIINAAFLIEKDEEQEFDQRVQQLNEKFGDKIRFKYLGTIPPANFVNLIIVTDESDVSP